MFGASAATLLMVAILLGVGVVALEPKDNTAQLAQATSAASKDSGQCEQRYQQCMKQLSNTRGGAILCETQWNNCVSNKCKTKQTGSVMACPNDADCEMFCTEAVSRGKGGLPSVNCCEGGPKKPNLCRKSIDGKCVTPRREQESQNNNSITPPGVCAKDDTECYMQQMLEGLESQGTPNANCKALTPECLGMTNQEFDNWINSPYRPPVQFSDQPAFNESTGKWEQFNPSTGKWDEISQLPYNQQLPDSTPLSDKQLIPAGFKPVAKPLPRFGEGEPPWDTELEGHTWETAPPLSLEDELVIEQTRLGPRDFCRFYPEHCTISPDLLNSGSRPYTPIPQRYLSPLQEPAAPMQQLPSITPPETFSIPGAPVAPMPPRPQGFWGNVWDSIQPWWPF